MDLMNYGTKRDSFQVIYVLLTKYFIMLTFRYLYMFKFTKSRDDFNQTRLAQRFDCLLTTEREISRTIKLDLSRQKSHGTILS
jgi:hypothetical protein